MTLVSAAATAAAVSNGNHPTRPSPSGGGGVFVLATSNLYISQACYTLSATQ